jgi:hypothetical protein
VQTTSAAQFLLLDLLGLVVLSCSSHSQGRRGEPEPSLDLVVPVMLFFILVVTPVLTIVTVVTPA